MKTSKDLNLRTEASSRFEKKIDPELTVIGLSRFEDILEGITGKVNSSCIYDSYLKTPRKKSININPDKTEKILGKRLEDNELSDILESLGFKTSKKDMGTLEVGVPSYRAEDITREIDLIEEIARIYGFNRFESCPPKGFLKKGMLTKMQKDVRKVRDFLSCSGLYEVINYSFISKGLFKKTRLLDDSKYSNHVKILNPINEDYKYMRTSLLPSLLKNVKDNIKYGYSDLGLFEVSKVFYKNKKGELPVEDLNLGVLLTGCKKMKGWENKQSFFNYYDIKGYLEGLIDIFSRGGRAEIEKKEYGFFHPVISADVKVNGKKVGIIGSVHPAVLEGFDIENDTFYLEISLDPFLEQVRKEKCFNKISTYPSVDIDIAIIVDEDTDNSDITEEIKKLGGKILKSIRLFDLYKGKQIQAGKKSMAYSLNFRGDKGTLKDNEVDIVVSRIVEGLKKSFSAKLRD